MSWGKHLGDVIRQQGGEAGSTVITDLLDRGLHARQEQRNAERLAERGTLVQQNPWATDIGKCERAIHFSLTGVEETDPLTTPTLVNFAVGHAVEEAFGGILGMSGAIVVREQKVGITWKGTLVTGRLDYAVLIPEAQVIIELKKVSSRWRGYMLKNGMDADPRHKSQLRFYLHGSQLGQFKVKAPGVHPHPSALVGPDGEGVVHTTFAPAFDLGYVIYVIADATKGEPAFQAVPVKYDKAAAEADLEWLHRQAVAAKKGEDPGIPEGYKKSKFPCAYCPYKGVCWP